MPDVSLATPSIEGKDLSQKPVRLPADLPPGPCVFLLAFSPAHQSEAMTWVDTLSDLALNQHVSVRQVIVLPTFAKMGERLVIDQLSKVVPAEAHDATLVAFADQNAMARALGASDTSHITLAVMDASQRIVWTGSGPHTSDAEAALRAKVAA